MKQNKVHSDLPPKSLKVNRLKNVNKAKDAYDVVVKGEKPPEESKKPVKIEIEKKGKE